MGVNKVVSTGLLVAVVAVSVGCEKLENKPKAPLVEGAPSPFYGAQNGVEVDIQKGNARYYESRVGAGAKFTHLDYLSPLTASGSFPVIKNGEYRVDRDFSWFSERNNSRSQFGGYDIDGRNWYLVNLSEESLAIHFKSLDPLDTESVTDDVSVIDGEFSCLQHTIHPEPEVREFDLSVAQGNAVFTDKTPGAFGAVQLLTLTAEADARFDVSGGVQTFARTCSGSGSAGLQDDFYDYLDKAYSSTTTYYNTCWSMVAKGGYQLDGEALYFTYIAMAEAEVRRLYDVNPADGLEDSTGEAMPRSFVDKNNDGLQDNFTPRPPSDIGALITPNNEGVTGLVGYRPVRSTTYCLRKGNELSVQNLAGSFWVGQSVKEGNEKYVGFSKAGYDGNGLAAEVQLETSSPANLRDLAYPYLVESNGVITVDGGKGMMSTDGRMIMYDVSNPFLNRVGIAIGIKEAQLQEVKVEE
jgi:hypothetical protein